MRGRAKLGKASEEDVGCVIHSINFVRGVARDRGGWRDKELETLKRKLLESLL